MKKLFLLFFTGVLAGYTGLAGPGHLAGSGGSCNFYNDFAGTRGMPAATDSFSRYFKLLPRPQKITLLKGNGLQYADLDHICLKNTARPPVMPEMLESLPIKGVLTKDALKKDVQTRGALDLVIDKDLDIPSDEGYILEIQNARVVIRAREQAGLFYGLQTLGQLLEDAHDQSVKIPACRIVDYPSISCRAVHIDLKSHLDAGHYYYSIIDRLAKIKVNTVIIEFEDKLRYRKAGAVGASNAISIEEFIAIGKYAKDRNIEISPLVQGLGHASFILKHDRYKELRDDSLSDFVFDPLNPKTYELQFSLYEDAIAATPFGKYLHVGGDEVGALGKSTLSKASGMKPLELQLYWLKKVTDFAIAHHRIPIFWDDMLFKIAGLYETTYDPAVSAEKAGELWNKNKQVLNDNLSLFPSTCIYARWNYETPALPGNKMALDWYKTHHLDVMAATASQQSYLLLPRNHSNFNGIRDFCQLSAAKKIDKIVCTNWDDSSPHFETTWRGIYDFALFSWNASDCPEPAAHTMFRHRFYSPALSADSLDFQNKLEDEVTFWETAFLKDGDRENYHPSFNLVELPDPQQPGKWSSLYKDRIERAALSDSLYYEGKHRIGKSLLLARRNRYALEVMDQINEVQSYSARLLLLLHRYDASTEGGREKAVQQIEKCLAEFPEIRKKFENVYAVTRILKIPDDYSWDSNPRAHWADVPNHTDWDNTTDWNFFIELQMNKKVEAWLHPFYTVADFGAVKKIDSHEHITEEADTAFIRQAEADNFRVLNINVYGTDGTPIEEQQAFALKEIRDYPGRMTYATTFSLKNFNRPGWQEEVIGYLKQSFAQGAVAVKVWKNVGMELRDTAGKLVFIDDPRFDPILDFLAKSHIPLIGHLGEHKNSWLPLDKMTVKGNRDYARTHPDQHMYLHPDRPSYEEYIRVRDHMLEKHPDLIFIGAHLGCLEWSVDELAKRLDKFPNMAVDMAERISHLQYQALTNWQKVHDFFIKYQDRLLYGTDLRCGASDIVNENIKGPEGLERHAHEVWLRHWRFFTTDDLMQVPKVEGAFKGLKLPRDVVDKIYYKNALRWIPGISK